MRLKTVARPQNALLYNITAVLIQAFFHNFIGTKAKNREIGDASDSFESNNKFFTEIS